MKRTYESIFTASEHKNHRQHENQLIAGKIGQRGVTVTEVAQLAEFWRKKQANFRERVAKRMLPD